MTLDDDAYAVLVPWEQLPDKWRRRARPVALVSLLHDEMQPLLAAAPQPVLDEADEVLAAGLSTGRSVPAIARDMGLSVRQVYRRLAGLRARVGAASTAELLDRLRRLGLLSASDVQTSEEPANGGTK